MPTMEVTEIEKTMILANREQVVKDRFYNMGLEAAARKAEAWAAECGGGTGVGGEGYRNLASAIRKIDPHRGY